MSPSKHERFLKDKDKGKGTKDRRGGRAAVTAIDQQALANKLLDNLQESARTNDRSRALST